MKKMVRPSTDPQKLEINIDITFGLDSTDIAATTIQPIIDSQGKLDPQSLADYQAFVETVMGILDYYEFQILSVSDSGTFPHTSKYLWIAHISEVEANDIPLLFKLRISDHVQQFSPESEKRLKRKTREEAEELKQPKSKKRQRYKVIEIVANNESMETYEEALGFVDKTIYSWLEKLDVDMSDFEEPLNNW